MNKNLLIEDHSLMTHHSLKYVNDEVEILVFLEETGECPRVELILSSGEDFSPYEALSDADAIQMGEYLAKSSALGQLYGAIKEYFYPYQA